MARLQKKIAAAKKRRQQRPRPAARSVSPIGMGAMRRMVEDRPDVLQNIEFTLVEAFRSDNDVDDVVVYSAMRAFILDDEPADDTIHEVWRELHDIREFRDDISDAVFSDGLRVIMGSVRRHSSLRPGSTQYLAFIDFVMP